MHRSHACRRDFVVFLLLLRALAIFGLAGAALWLVSAASAATTTLLMQAALVVE